MTDTTTQPLSAEITVSTDGSGGSTPMTAEAFLKLLRANGFKGNVASNPNMPEKAWIEFRNQA